VKGTLQEDLYTLMITSNSNLLGMWSVSGKIYRENLNKHCIFGKSFLRTIVPSWDNVKKLRTARRATVDNIKRRMRFACWITRERIRTLSQNI